MRVRESDLGGVLLSVINDLQLRPGGLVTLDRLANSWAKVGLRSQDLEIGIAQLIDSELMYTDKGLDGETCLALSSEGHKKALASASALSLIASSAQRLRRSSERRQKKIKDAPQKTPTSERRAKPKA